MESVDTKITENHLEEQITVFEKDGKLLIKTSDGFNISPVPKQNQIVSTVVEILLKSNKTDTLFTVGLTEESEISMKVLDNFTCLSLHSQEAILRKLSLMMRKMSEIKSLEKINSSEWLN